MFQTKRFDNFIKLNRGFDLPDDKIVSGKYPVVASTSVKAYHNEFKVKAPAVVTGRSGSLGKIQFIDNDCWPLNITLYVKDFKGNNPKYVYYLLQTMHLEQYNAGAGVPTLNQNHLHSIKLKIHSLPTQERIADILSTYDDLIENNNKRIALLEKAAQELYKEWFVRFRFPGHETARFINGLPEGWTRRKINEFYNTCSGGTPSRSKSEYYENGVYPWVKTGEIRDSIVIDAEEYITENAIRNSSAKLLPAKSVVMAMYGVNIGMLAYFDQEMACNQACCVFSDKRNFPSRHYLFQYLLSIREYLLLIGFGAAQQNLSQDLIKRVKILMPTDGLVTAFEKKVDDYYESIRNLMMCNQNLTKQRDLLLPRLMSGKLEV